MAVTAVNMRRPRGQCKVNKGGRSRAQSTRTTVERWPSVETCLAAGGLVTLAGTGREAQAPAPAPTPSARGTGSDVACYVLLTDAYKKAKEYKQRLVVRMLKADEQMDRVSGFSAAVAAVASRSVRDCGCLQATAAMALIMHRSRHGGNPEKP